MEKVTLPARRKLHSFRPNSPYLSGDSQKTLSWLSIPLSFLYSFLDITELVLGLDMNEIFADARYATNNQSSNGHDHLPCMFGAMCTVHYKAYSVNTILKYAWRVLPFPPPIKLTDTTKEEFEDTKRVIRIRISKNRQHNGQTKVQKDKKRSTKHTYKTKDRVTRTPLKTRGELRY